MSNRAKYLGAVGTVIDGRLRDLQEHRDLEFPVGRAINGCRGDVC
jgi:regulator of RNase E activity RraA